MRIGIDVGGTKIEIAALDDAGAFRLRRRVPTPADDYDRIVRTVVELIAGADREVGPCARVGIGTPGSLGPDGRLRNSNTVCLNGRSFARDVAAALGREVRVANDANCFALSEAVDGAAAGATVVFGVICGTGCGGGLVVRGEVIAGCQGIAGEWGHNPLPWPRPDELPGPPCYCGKHGCIETFLSGPAVVRDHAAHGGDASTLQQIAAAAADGDSFGLATLERHADRFARALATVINMVDPEVVVLGGGVGNLVHLEAELRRRLPRWVFCDELRTRITRPLPGDSSGVRGAAWLW